MGSGVGGDGLVGWGRGGVVAGLTLIPHVSNVAGVGIGGVVGHDLDTAVGKGYTVLAVGGIVVTSLVLAEVDTSVVILDGVLVLVLGWHIGVGGLLVGGGAVSRGRGGVGVVVSRGVSDGDSQEGRESNEDLMKRHKAPFS